MFIIHTQSLVLIYNKATTKKDKKLHKQINNPKCNQLYLQSVILHQLDFIYKKSQGFLFLTELVNAKEAKYDAVH